MKHFQKNVFRLAGQNRGSFIGAMFIIAIGIFVYVAMMDTLWNLKGQVEAYYESSHLADVFAEVSGISESELKRLKEIPGILDVSGKMAADVRLLADGQEEIVTVHLLSYDEDDSLNQLTLTDADGRYGMTGETGSQETAAGYDNLYLGGRMAEVYGYQGGEAMKLLINGRAVNVQFAGTCHGPEYIYSIPPGGAMVPDGEVYDIAGMEKSRMEEITGRHDSLNELGFTLASGYEFEDVSHGLTEQLENFGLISLTKREDQGSYDMVQGEMGELISIGTILPVIFMAISVFMLYVVLKKMIDRDQSLIGTMKAFGMTDRELMGAYLFEGVAIGAVGAAAGSILAIPFGQYMFDMYVDFFNLPDTIYHNYLGSRISGLALAVGTGLLAAFLGVRDILSIAPAQAMRAKAPAAVQNLFIPEFLLKRLGPLERMGCRAIARNPFRGFLIALAIGFPFSMSSVLLSFQGIADQMFMDQFEKIQIYDFQISLNRYDTPIRAAQSGEVLEGVTVSEAVCTAAAELKKENRSKFVMLYGLNPGSENWLVMDNQGQYYEPPDGGILINSRIAEDLHVEAGDMIEITCPGMTVEQVKIPVVGVIAESFGSGCYMSLESFGKLFQTRCPANTVLLKVKEGKKEQVKQKLMETSQVTWLVDAGKIIGSYQDMMGSMLAMIHMFSIMSVAAGGILIYNISMINIRERVNEFGTLMVLGESEREIGRMILFEQAVYFLAGIAMGYPGSMGIRLLLEKLVISDSYTVNLNVGPLSYLMAFFTCLGITFVSCMAQVRFVGRIHLTDILKERE